MTEQASQHATEVTADRAVALPHIVDPIAATPTDVIILLDKLREVSVEDLLADDITQTRLDLLLAVYGDSRSLRDSTNNDPVLIIKSYDTNEVGTPGYTDAREPRRFRVNDDDHIYYFSQYPQQAEPTHGEKERTLFTTRLNDWQPVIHTHNILSRVPINGGFVQSYNYAQGEWEKDKHHYYLGIGKGNERKSSLGRAGVISMYKRSNPKN